MGAVPRDPVTGKPVRMHVSEVPAFDKRSPDRKEREAAVKRGDKDWRPANIETLRDTGKLFNEQFEVLSCGSIVPRYASPTGAKPFVSKGVKRGNKRGGHLTKQHNHRDNRFGKIPDSKVRVLQKPAGPE